MPAALRATHPVTSSAIRPAARRAVGRPMFGVVLLATLGACASRPASETGLNKDLALANQLQRQSAPPLVTSPELIHTQAPDSVGVPVRATPSARASLVRTRVVTTRVITRTVMTPVARPIRGATGETGRGFGRTDAGEVVATRPASPADRQGAITTGAYGSAASTSTSDAVTSGSGTYGVGTSAGGAGPSTAGSAEGSSDASVPVSRQTQAHATRDGVFGSVAGAIIGAAASGHGNRVRGGLIGAVAGGALGAIYGGSVDRSIPTYAPTYASGARGGRAYRTY